MTKRNIFYIIGCFFIFILQEASAQFSGLENYIDDVEIKNRITNLEKEWEKQSAEAKELREDAENTSNSNKAEKKRLQADEEEIKAQKAIIKAYETIKEAVLSKTQEIKEDSLSTNIEVIRAQIALRNAYDKFDEAGIVKSNINEDSNIATQLKNYKNVANLQKEGLEYISKAFGHYFKTGEEEEKTDDETGKQIYDNTTTDSYKVNTTVNAKDKEVPSPGNGKEVVINEELLRNIKKALNNLDLTNKNFLFENMRREIHSKTISSKRFKEIWYAYINAPMPEELIAGVDNTGEPQVDTTTIAIKDQPTKTDTLPTPTVKKDEKENVFYTLQIASSTTPLSYDVLYEKYHGRLIISELYKKGIYKYLIGVEPTYNHALELRSELGLYNATVIALEKDKKNNLREIDTELADKGITTKKDEAPGASTQNYEPNVNEYRSEDIVFKIQIAANHKPLNNSALNNIYKGNQGIDRHHIGSWYKYSVGEYNTYPEAKRNKNNVNVEGAFITAYQQGNLLNLQDAIRATSPGYYSKSEGHSSIPKGKHYRIQIAASRTQLNKIKISQIYDGKFTVDRVYENGWHRYTIGNFQTYADALETRKQLHVESFITLYKNGKRVIPLSLGYTASECPGLEIIKGLNNAGGGIIFKLQIAASKKPLSKQYLKNIYCDNKDITEIYYDNWYKYSIGEYHNYYEAIEIKKNVNIHGAFIVAFRHNTPMNLFEAIHQKK